MRRLLIAVLVLVALWAGYWFGAARLIERGTEDWFKDQTEAGMLSGHDGLRVTGFPLRFALDITRPHLADTASGTGWSAPEARITAQAWMPWQVTLDLPEQQIVDLPGQEVTISSSAISATVAVTPGTTLPLDWTAISGDGLSLLSSQGWSLGIARLMAQTQRTAADPLTHEVQAEATSITPDEGFRSRLATQSTLPELIDGLRLEATLSLTAPLDRHAPATQPRLTVFNLRDAALTWGDLVLSASGAVEADAQGFAAGQIDLRLTGWRELVPVLVAAQLVKPEVAPTITRALEVMAKNGTAEVLDMSLILSEGWMRLGPIPLGPAPLLDDQRQ
ncbi:MAG: High-affinity K+ transporter ATPase chain B [Rhodobacteraceae bacterium PARR1]|nr:MAG: High-affinity K+ transporter ATPase chain B [Rhodobacteraceae bacterium PARR1]